MKFAVKLLNKFELNRRLYVQCWHLTTRTSSSVYFQLEKEILKSGFSVLFTCRFLYVRSLAR